MKLYLQFVVYFMARKTASDQELLRKTIHLVAQ